MSQMIRKANAFEILNHWALAVSFFILTLTGFAFLFHLQQMTALFGSFAQMKVIHNWSGVVFVVSLFFTMFNYLPISLTYSGDDFRWILSAGGYLWKTDKVPPQDKINTGQKLFYLVLLAAGYAIAASGIIIWFQSGAKQAVLMSHLIHNITFDVMVAMIPIHIYLGTIGNPGTIRIMISGTVPLEWAKSHHPKWVKRMGY